MKIKEKYRKTSGLNKLDMLKYLIILLDDSSENFCNYQPKIQSKLIPLDILKKAIKFALKENLDVQFVWPKYQLPNAYLKEISSIDHIDIVPIELTNKADIIVSTPKDFGKCPEEAVIVAKMTLEEFLNQPSLLFPLLKKAKRVNLIFSNIEGFNDTLIDKYKLSLEKVSDYIFQEISTGHNLQVNLLTDRMMLKNMNNCNAGYETLTLAPDGNFYICPAFYYGEKNSVGTVESGIAIKNSQLYNLEYAPICRECDAFHCRRCVWLNEKFTLEVNTPGHEQCVMSHLERNTTRNLCSRIRSISAIFPGEDIPEINYIDPFDKIIK